MLEWTPRVLAGQLVYWASFLQETFKNEGLDFTINGLTGNTLNSHRLIAYAGRQGYDIQDKLVEELFKAYFTEASPFLHLRRLDLLACTSTCIPSASAQVYLCTSYISACARPGTW